MPTQILQVLADEKHPGSKSVVVEEGFDEVLERVFPMTTPRTQEEFRGERIYRTLDGRRCFIHPENVFYFEENPPEE